MNQIEKRLKERGHSSPEIGLKNIQLDAFDPMKLQMAAEHFAKSYDRQIGPYGGSEGSYYNVNLDFNTARHEGNKIIVGGTWSWETQYGEGGTQKFTMTFDADFYGVLSVEHGYGDKDWDEI